MNTKGRQQVHITNDGVSTENLGSASPGNIVVPAVTLSDLKSLQQSKEKKRRPNWNYEGPKKKHPKEEVFELPKKKGESNGEIFDHKWLYNSADERLPQWSGSIQNQKPEVRGHRPKVNRDIAGAALDGAEKLA